MSDEKAKAAKRTGKKAVAVTDAAKSKTPTTAAMTQSTTSKKTVSNASADVVPVPAKVVRSAAAASKARTPRPTVKTAANAAKAIEPEKVPSALKSPGLGSARPEAIEEANGASAAAKVLGDLILPARKVATSKPEGEVKPASLAAKKLIEKPAEPSNEERQRWIATAAYHRAEERGFAPGYEVQDWLDAEAEINELIGKARSNDQA